MESTFGRVGGSHRMPTTISVVAQMDCMWPSASWLKVWECTPKTQGTGTQQMKSPRRRVYGQVRAQCKRECPGAQWGKDWHCHCSGSGHCCGVGLMPGTSACCGCSWLNETKQVWGFELPLDRGGSSPCWQNRDLFCSIFKVIQPFPPLTLEHLLGKGQTHASRDVAIMFDSFWMTAKSLVVWPSINCLYELIWKTKTVKGFSKANKIANSRFDFTFSPPGRLDLASIYARWKVTSKNFLFFSLLFLSFLFKIIIRHFYLMGCLIGNSYLIILVGFLSTCNMTINWC